MLTVASVLPWTEWVQMPALSSSGGCGEPKSVLNPCSLGLACSRTNGLYTPVPVGRLRIELQMVPSVPATSVCPAVRSMGGKASADAELRNSNAPQRKIALLSIFVTPQSRCLGPGARCDGPPTNAPRRWRYRQRRATSTPYTFLSTDYERSNRSVTRLFFRKAGLLYHFFCRGAPVPALCFKSSRTCAPRGDSGYSRTILCKYLLDLGLSPFARAIWAPWNSASTVMGAPRSSVAI